MKNLNELVQYLGPILKRNLLTKIESKLASLQNKVTKQGKPYNTTYLLELQTLARVCNYENLLKDLLISLRETSEDNLVSIHCFINNVIPKEFTLIEMTHKTTRMGQWSGLIVGCLLDMKIISRTLDVIEPKSNNIHAHLMDGFYLNKKLIIEDYNSSVINTPNIKPRNTHRVLGSLWVKDGNMLDHSDVIINLLNSTPLTFNQNIMEKMNYQFELSEPDKKDWDSLKFPKYEDWIEAREKAHEAYISKLPEFIREETSVVYNTYAPDSRGRLYPTNDTGNMVGLKYIRAVIQSAKSDKIEID